MNATLEFTEFTEFTPRESLEVSDSDPKACTGEDDPGCPAHSHSVTPKCVWDSNAVKGVVLGVALLVVIAGVITYEIVTSEH